jgi:hypothetical protein
MLFDNCASFRVQYGVCGWVKGVDEGDSGSARERVEEGDLVVQKTWTNVNVLVREEEDARWVEVHTSQLRKADKLSFLSTGNYSRVCLLFHQCSIYQYIGCSLLHHRLLVPRQSGTWEMPNSLIQ